MMVDCSEQGATLSMASWHVQRPSHQMFGSFSRWELELWIDKAIALLPKWHACHNPQKQLGPRSAVGTWYAFEIVVLWGPYSSSPKRDHNLGYNPKGPRTQIVGL